MSMKRKHTRITFNSLCVVDGESESIPCKLENVSEDGALINMATPVSSLKVGDIIHLKTIFLSPVELDCVITRVESDRIAVEYR